jgi:hypothetical protein
MIWFSKPLQETNRKLKHFLSLTEAISPNRRVVKHQKRSQFQTFQSFQTFNRFAPFKSFNLNTAASSRRSTATLRSSRSNRFEELKARKKQFERFGILEMVTTVTRTGFRGQYIEKSTRQVGRMHCGNGVKLTGANSPRKMKRYTGKHDPVAEICCNC